MGDKDHEGDSLKLMREQIAILQGNMKLLQEINQNTKSPDDEVWHRPRSDFGHGKVTLNVRVNIIAIGDIDSVAQEFKCDLYIICKYKEPVLKGMTREEVDWTEQWDPRVVMGNAVDISSMVKKHYLNYEDGDDIPTVSLSHRLKGTFKEKLELERFPFDYQELTISIHSDWPDTDVEFVKDMGIKDSIRLDTFSGVQEWQLCQHIMGAPEDVQREAAGAHRIYPRYNVRTNVIRRPAYYLWNVALIMAFIMLLTFASLSVPSTDVADRLSVTLTLLLTSVAFKFVVSQSLPTISYLTLLDTYVIICMIVQVSMAAQNAVASLFQDPATALLFDHICAYVIGGFVVTAHIVFGIIIAVWIHKRNIYLHRTTKDYFALCDKINEAYREKMSKISQQPLEPVTSVNETPKRRKNKKNAVDDMGNGSQNSFNSIPAKTEGSQSGNEVV